MNKAGTTRSTSLINYRVNIALGIVVGVIIGLMAYFHSHLRHSMQLVWADEFNGRAGAPVDAAKWNHDIGGDGWGNNEWQYYTDSPANASLNGHGYLTIQALRPDKQHGKCALGPCDITSARLQTDGTFSGTYGRFEARMKLPTGQGIWPAFWLLSTKNQGEIDIAETKGNNRQAISGSLHGPGYSGEGAFTKTYTLPLGHSIDDGFHVYAVAWTDQRIEWSVDSVVYQTVAKTEVSPKPWVFARPYYFVLNVAVGGDYSGYPDSTTTFPAKLEVDYVRVYQSK